MNSKSSESPPTNLRVILLPPTSRDGQALHKLLTQLGIAFKLCAKMSDVCEQLEAGAGAIVVSEESLHIGHEALAKCVQAQPVWSDLPIVVLSKSGVEAPTLTAIIATLGNVSVLERPLRMSTLTSVVRSALRARERQYQVREHLLAREQAKAELQATADRLQLAVQTGKLGVWALDLRTFEMTCSTTYKANFGRATDAEFSYTDLWESVHPEDADRVRAAVNASIADGSDFEIEYRIIWPDGSTHWMLARGRTTAAMNGAPNKLIGVTLDITERRSVEEQRTALLEAERAARSEAERAGRMKDEFLATLSHELRTPLNAVLGWAQLLQTPSLDPDEMAEGISIIERNARAQAQIIEDLLDMSRIISGVVRLEVQRLDLASVIQAAVDTVQPAANAKEIRMRTALDPAAAPITGDPNRLQQVFWNLLSNAVKFTPNQGNIQVVLKRKNSHVEVSVNDNGEGMEPEFLPYVFDRFRQADATSARKHGGLGLGLAIVRQLVELHGGTIAVKSEGKNRGASFIVSLPMVAVHAKPEPQIGRRLPAANATASISHKLARMTGIKIVVVDDEPDVRTLLQRLLEECEATVYAAASAKEGLRLIQAERPHVLISDIGMPEQDGYELIRRVRALSADFGGETHAVALTAYARPEDRDAAIVAGFQHHLTKPVDPAELIAIVNNLARCAPAE